MFYFILMLVFVICYFTGETFARETFAKREVHSNDAPYKTVEDAKLLYIYQRAGKLLKQCTELVKMLLWAISFFIN